MEEIQNGDKVCVKGEREVFTVSQLSGNRCWISDEQGYGWYIHVGQLELVTEDDSDEE